MIEQLNAIACLWWSWSIAMFWQVGLLILLIAAIDRLIRRWAWPQLRYALWSLILVKLLLPPSLSLPSGIVPGLAPVARKALARLETQEPPAESRTLLFLNEEMLRIPDAGSDGIVESARSAPVRAYSETSYDVAANGLPVPTAEAGSSVRIAWQVYAMAASLAGTLILGIGLFLRLHSFVGRNAQVAAAASLPQSFYNQLAGCARRLELRCIPRVVVTKRLANPAVFGVVRPVLLMPKGYLSKLSRRDTEHMLLHELAHFKRGDLVAHNLYMLLQIVYWYNPLLWLVRRQVHHLRELSCDATVAELLRERTSAYRQTLLETARRLLTSSVEPGLGLLGLFEDSNRLVVRLNWLARPTWRYRTMKRVTVAIIAALMLACVLPMARAQEAAPKEQPLQVVTEGVPSSSRGQETRAAEDPTVREIAALQASLAKLMVQQQQLQEQLRILAEKRGQAEAKDTPKLKLKPLNLPAPVQPHVEKTPSGRDVTVVPWQGKEPTEEDRRALQDAQARRVQMETLQATMEQQRARMEADRALLDSRRVKVEDYKAKAEDYKEMAKQMKQWEADVEKWQNSEEMKRWKQEVEEWGRELGRRHEQNAGQKSEDAAARPMPPMPPMPLMPPMPAVPPTPGGPNVHVVPATPQVPVMPRPVPHVNVHVPHVGTHVLPEVPATPKEPGDAVSCGDFVVKSLPAGTVLQVENAMGSIAVEGTKDSDCSITATARVKDMDRKEAERIAEKILVQVTPTDGHVRVRTQLPEEMNEQQRGRIEIDLRITAPRETNVQVTQKVGSVSLSSLQGDVKAAVEVGPVKTWNLQGNVAIRTNVGRIDFLTSADLSAKVSAQTQVGSISGNLPLEITGAAVVEAGKARNALGSRATGAFGDGRNKIDLATQVGPIEIRRQPAPPEREVF